MPLIDRKDVTLEGDLGKGAFGVVRQGTLQHDGTSIKIALKTLKEGATDNDRDALLAEARLVSQFKHPNVVACFGQVSSSVGFAPACCPPNPPQPPNPPPLRVFRLAHCSRCWTTWT